MTKDSVLVRRQDGIVELTMNDPETLNAWTEAMGNRLAAELARAESSPEDRVVILTGAGSRGFSSGGNIKDMAARGSLSGIPSKYSSDSPMPTLDFLDYGTSAVLQKLVRQMRKLPKPIIGAINGVAAGGGLALAAACDIRIASETARFTSVFVRRGMTPHDGTSFLLPEIIGRGRTMDLLLTGRIIDAHEADRIGLVSKVVVPEQLKSEVWAFARDIANNCSPIAVAITKRVLLDSYGEGLEETLLMEDRGFQRAVAAEDHKEALKAYSERRTPNYQFR